MDLMKIKSATDEVSRLKAEFSAAEREIVSNFNNGIVGLKKSGSKYLVQVFGADNLTNIANGNEIETRFRDSGLYPFELAYEIDDIEFFAILDEREYANYKGTKKEGRPRGVSLDELKMKESGMKESDFR